MAKPEPYQPDELLTAARGGQPLDPLRVLATYAARDNWVPIHGGRTSPEDEYEAKACEWAFIGGVRPPYELAEWALKGGESDG